MDRHDRLLRDLAQEFVWNTLDVDDGLIYEYLDSEPDDRLTGMTYEELKNISRDIETLLSDYFEIRFKENDCE